MRDFSRGPLPARVIREGPHHFYWRCDHCKEQGKRVLTRTVASKQRDDHNFSVNHEGPPCE